MNIVIHVTYNNIINRCTYNIVGSLGSVRHIVNQVYTAVTLLGLKEVPGEQACTSLHQQWHISRGKKINPLQ